MTTVRKVCRGNPGEVNARNTWQFTNRGAAAPRSHYGRAPARSRCADRSANVAWWRVRAIVGVPALAGGRQTTAKPP